MHRKKIKIKSSFDLTFYEILKKINCSFEISDSKNFEIHGQTENVSLCNGKLKINNNENESIINSAILTFFYPNIKTPNTIDYDTNHYTDGINGVKNWHWNNTFEIHSENLIADKVNVIDGNYTAFVRNGIYDIKVEYDNKVELVKNQEVTEGLDKEYYYIVDSLIKKKLNSTNIMHNHYARNIDISILNQYEHLDHGELIISQNNNLIVYRIIDEKVMFALEPGIYDIRLRNEKMSVKIIKDFEFGENDDFVDKLVSYFDNDFKKIEPIKPSPEPPKEPENDENYILEGE